MNDISNDKNYEDGFIKASKVSVCAVQRFIKNNNLKTSAGVCVKDRKAFACHKGEGNAGVFLPT